MPIKSKKWRNNLLAFVIGFVLILLFEIIPGIIDVTGQFFEMFAQQSKIEDNDLNRAKLAGLNASNKEIMRQINSLVSDYNEAGKLSTVISFLDTLTINNNAKIASIIPGKIEKEKQLITLPVQILIESTYEDFYGFINSLEKSSKVVVIKSIKIEADKALTSKLKITAELQFCLNLI